MVIFSLQVCDTISCSVHNLFVKEVNNYFALIPEFYHHCLQLSFIFQLKCLLTRVERLMELICWILVRFGDIMRLKLNPHVSSYKLFVHVIFTTYYWNKVKTHGETILAFLFTNCNSLRKSLVLSWLFCWN